MIIPEPQLSIDSPLVTPELVTPELVTPEPTDPSQTSESWTIYGPSVNLENRPDIDEIASLCWSINSSEDSICITPPPSPISLTLDNSDGRENLDGRLKLTT